MGNICCTGRLLSKIPQESPTRVQKVNKKQRLKKKQSKGKQITSKINKSQDLIPKRLIEETQQVLDKSELTHNTILETKSQTSNQSEIAKSQDDTSKGPSDNEDIRYTSLHYDLNSVSQLNDEQQKHILALIIKYELINGEDYKEYIDGIIEVIEHSLSGNHSRTLLFSTKALYVFDQDDFSQLIRRTEIDAIIFF